ncbi:hypothetical protein TSUD_174170 [Trifolium subterraneum]|nr:hypothetical protein TSUD_174170 [Trifolium subterraneum]
MSQSLRQSNPPPPPILPDDLIIEILSFLKVKPLMKMKCVSKIWKTLISDPKFVKIHLNQSSQSSHLYTVSNNHSIWRHDRFISFSIHDLLDNRWINIPSDPYYSLNDKDCREVVGSCNGLVCLLGYSPRVKDGYLWWFRIWNPATRTISDKLGYLRDDNDMYWRKFTFGYDSSTDTYKIMALHMAVDETTTEVGFLSFGNNAWRNIHRFPIVLLMLCFPNSPAYGCVHLNCTVNCLAYTENGNRVIISFDLHTETHTQLKPPLGFQSATARICVLKDTLCFIHDIKYTDFVIWKMTKFGDEKSWTQFLKCSYHGLQMDSTAIYTINVIENGDTLVLIKGYQGRVNTIDSWKWQLDPHDGNSIKEVYHLLSKEDQ